VGHKQISDILFSEQSNPLNALEMDQMGCASLLAYVNAGMHLGYRLKMQRASEMFTQWRYARILFKVVIPQTNLLWHPLPCSITPLQIIFPRLSRFSLGRAVDKAKHCRNAEGSALVGPFF